MQKNPISQPVAIYEKTICSESGYYEILRNNRCTDVQWKQDDQTDTPIIQKFNQAISGS